MYTSATKLKQDETDQEQHETDHETDQEQQQTDQQPDQEYHTSGKLTI